MTATPAYTQTNESITVVLEGTPYTIKREQKNWDAVKTAVFHEDWEELARMISPKIPIEQWASGEFTVQDNLIFYNSEPIDQRLNERILEMAEAGDDPSFMFAFWKRLQLNPSSRSVAQLYPFMAHQGIPIVEGGYFLAYKGVKDDYTDCHTGKVDNKPGTVNEMRRNRISDDPNYACHYGFHVGDESYATSFGSRTVVVKVDPADVVCIPYDSGQRKMRVCKYEVVGHYGGQLLPSTTFEEGKVEEMDSSGVDEADVVDESEAEPVRFWVAGVVVSGWEDFHKLSDGVLATQKLGDLRKYASKVCQIVGASKLRGGKSALLEKLYQVRADLGVS